MMTRPAYVRWVRGDDHGDYRLTIRQVGILRFDNESGLDPRVCPEPEGTHLSRGNPLNTMGTLEASCGKRGLGFTDYGSITSVTCLTCAAQLAAQLLEDIHE